MTLDLRHAWAVLGLRPGSSVRQARSRYVSLAKLWHPDRHAGSDYQDEALQRMRLINEAYRCILQAAAAVPPGATPVVEPGLAPTGRRLSRAEIDHFVATMGTESWVESAFGSTPYFDALGWFLHKAPGNQWSLSPGAKTGLVFLVGCLVILLLKHDVDPLNSRLWYAAFAAMLLASYYWSNRS